MYTLCNSPAEGLNTACSLYLFTVCMNVSSMTMHDTEGLALFDLSLVSVPQLTVVIQYSNRCV